MKQINLIILLTALTIGGWSCSDSVPTEEILLSEDMEDITFQTIRSNYALGDTVTAILQNKSSSSIEYGNPFQVEQKIDGEWTSVGPTGAFTLEAYGLQLGNQTAYRFALADSNELFPKHSFSEGQYRVITGIGVQRENLSLATPPFDVSAPSQ